MSTLEPAVLGTIATVLVLYLVVLILIGWSAARRTHGGEDFHLAGRSLGAWAAGISSTASSESGWVTLGAVGMAYTHGVSGLWFAPGCLLGYLVNLYFVAPRLQTLSREQGSLTLTDVIARRWGDPGNLLRTVSVVIIVLSMMGYVAAQMTAAGKAFSSTLGIAGGSVNVLGLPIPGYALGVLIGAAVITLVTSLGGFRGVAWTDLFQGLLMVFGLIILPFLAVSRLGGFGALIDGLGAINPEYLTAGGARTQAAAIGFIVGEMGIGLGYPGMPHVITRYMAARGPEDIRRIRLIGMLWGVAVLYGAGVLGIAGRVMFPGLDDPERTMMVVSLTLLPAAVAGLMLAAVISAILSTVSSQLLAAASAVSYDVVEGVMGRHPDDRRSLRLGRWTVAIVGLLGMLTALSEVRVVFWFVLFAWSALGASFGPLILYALSRRRMNHHGALAGMLTGFGVTIAWKLGRGAADDPAAFALVPWGVLVVAAILLLVGGMRRTMDHGGRFAVVTAAVVTMGGWFLVQQWGLDQLYELVPAFALAAAVAPAVSRLTAARESV